MRCLFLIICRIQRDIPDSVVSGSLCNLALVPKMVLYAFTKFFLFQNKCAGFAFIYMEDERDAEDAIRSLDRTEFGRQGRRLRVEWTKVNTTE